MPQGPIERLDCLISSVDQQADTVINYVPVLIQINKYSLPAAKTMNQYD
jgi:hypothetical protein